MSGSIPGRISPRRMKAFASHLSRAAPEMLRPSESAPGSYSPRRRVRSALDRHFCETGQKSGSGKRHEGERRTPPDLLEPRFWIVSGSPTILELSRRGSHRDVVYGHFYLWGIVGIESNLLNEVLHFVSVSTRRFNSSNQFSTTLICVGADTAS
jgi:hypothetical protein